MIGDIGLPGEGRASASHTVVLVVVPMTDDRERDRGDDGDQTNHKEQLNDREGFFGFHTTGIGFRRHTASLSHNNQRPIWRNLPPPLQFLRWRSH